MAQQFAEHLGFGCVGLTGCATAWHANRLLRTAYACGIRHFDTAPVYGQGYSERILGRFLRDHPDATVTTKLGGPPPSPTLPLWLALAFNRLRRWLRPGRTHVRDLHPPPLAPRRIRRSDAERSLAQSRRALGREKLDYVLLHEALPSFLDDDARDFLFAERARGAIGRLGLAAHGSNYLGLEPRDLTDWDALQYECGPAWPEHTALRQKFPDKAHLCHSCILGRPAGQSAGAALAACLTASGADKVLFSSQSPQHIRDAVRDGAAAWGTH